MPKVRTQIKLFIVIHAGHSCTKLTFDNKVWALGIVSSLKLVSIGGLGPPPNSEQVTREGCIGPE